MTGLELIGLLIAWGVAGGSPGPATLTISGTAMAHGRAAGVTVGAGVLAGSAAWGLASALGMGTLMLANAWIAISLKYAGAAYLLYLAIKALRSAMAPSGKALQRGVSGSLNSVFLKGLLIHLTNPKAILSWGAIYAIALPPGAGFGAVFTLYLQLVSVSALVFLGYGVLFSLPMVSRGYARARRPFEALFAALFGAAALRIMTARIEGVH
ncbi:LysE family translocator [Alisedimentitalea sp. MJ-SS2]|uniref:LysE family translocator n=1 Tax=Aliisedimentitalea sp. MJ-SS2 TaxID=3049795 RepID=UPI0029092D4F|nr:LysE family translocator [Alisedimentitalea sp. MJ-SS2]MDU8927452.1 LysE family translocator [Alisedimentitalea sp. MJ-SS2]